jgi:hypothetical protein
VFSIISAEIKDRETIHVKTPRNKNIMLKVQENLSQELLKFFGYFIETRLKLMRCEFWWPAGLLEFDRCFIVCGGPFHHPFMKKWRS